MDDTRPKEAPILFFDGTCALCSATVQWALKHDRRGDLRFAPLDGATHKALGSPGADQGGSTLILVKDAQIFMRSAGAIRLFLALGGIWRILGWLLWVIPRPLRDAGYRFIAARRYRWFGRVEACAMPNDPTSRRVLD